MVEWDTRRLRIASEAAGVALWSWQVDTDAFQMDERACALWGLPNSGTITFDELSSRIHPEDLDKVRAAFAATRAIEGPYETDFRILHEGEVRWISARGRGDDQGIIGRVMFGIFLDVSVRKLAEEAREMISKEMDHRIKNLFTVAAALTQMSARASATKADMVSDLTQRLTALSAAHDLVRRGFHEQQKAVLLGVLMDTLLKPYVSPLVGSERVQVTAPDIRVGESSATALALIVHELATNAVKYGALSTETGTVYVACVADEAEVLVMWKEAGGPPVLKPQGRKGFGSQLVMRSVSGQLGGTMHVEWLPNGMLLTLRVSRARLGA